MFICEICLFVLYFPQFCTSDMSKYGYLEVFQRVPLTSRLRESTVYFFILQILYSSGTKLYICCTHAVEYHNLMEGKPNTLGVCGRGWGGIA